MSTTNILDLNNRVNALEKSYPANNVMMSDGVTSVEDRIDANTTSAATRVDISSYTNDNQYTCIADGYVELACNASGRTGTIYVNNTAMLDVTTSQVILSMYVKKGTKLFVNLSGGAAAFFYPIS